MLIRSLTNSVALGYNAAKFNHYTGVEARDNMSRGPLYEKHYVARFSGHETFPLRYGWLKKTYDRVAKAPGRERNMTDCWDDSAGAAFGVGKNMVASMRHWAKVVGIIDEDGQGSVRATNLGRRLLDDRGGLDPYMEHPSTLWLVHWQLAARPEKTTWFWAFNHYPAAAFDRDLLAGKLARFATDRNWPLAAATTLKNDVACFIRTYVPQQLSGKIGLDDALESPLTELGLIKRSDSRGGFRFVRGPKATLDSGIFTYALMDFWSRYSPGAKTLSFEAVAHAAGAPGRVFALPENDVAHRLAVLESTTAGALQWSETAGLKQVERNIDIDDDAGMEWLSRDYAATRQEAA